MQPPIILFDDDLGCFGPMADLRAAFEIRSGADSAVRRVARWAAGRLAALWVPRRLRDIVTERATLPVNELPSSIATDRPVVLLSGRLLLPDDALSPEAGQAIVDAHGDLVAASMEAVQAARLLDALAASSTPLLELLRQVFPAVRVVDRPDLHLARRPWDILGALARTITFDGLADRPRLAREAAPATVMGDHPVIIEASARLWPGVVIDAEHGAVIIRAKAVVRPHATLSGPCVVGEGATVLDQAMVRANTVIGPMCKVAGEISGTIFQGFANKAHDGFLGDSYVGKWANLGAGTTNSNLLNTYGEVSMRLAPGAPRERSGRQFLGAIIGDHAKMAIGTRLMTGTAIGTGAMVACTAPPPTCTPAFAWLTDEDPGGARRWRLDRFEETMRAVMARRDREPSAAYLRRVRDLHEAASAA